MGMDLNVRIPDKVALHDFITISKKLGLTGLGTQTCSSLMEEEDGQSIYKRIQLSGTKLGKLKSVIASQRYQATIIALTVGSLAISNWAAGDSRVDLLTLPESGKYKLKKSTARLASNTGTALEVIIAPLLKTKGLSRSLILKGYRTSVKTALAAKMDVVISSGAKTPYQMRSPKALSHIGYILGLNQQQADRAIFDIPERIVRYNQERLNRDIITRGLEIRRQQTE
ncbi:MAG: putative Ribonuclease P protein component 3 [Candidatus Thorarchaeota archaeon]|nr:MAG: putative Ribonuclease P protein component 3 [Candidatus Thorarchaeota archaeon]